ncbi:lysozyme [Pedobacter cryophilus]|uniref:Lysozyme n=2 Tax=Pedobacter cryophilus TaxID=2571271 RepID=A0A4V6WMW0_9SPHI|nr:lysozyme [Pedobacter cryophilus]
MTKPYKDGFINGVQQYSIGYGHQIRPNESHLKTSTITRAQADVLFEKDLIQYENAVNKASKPLSQNQFDALVSFAYNAGTGAVANVLKTWNATGDSLATTERMKLYNKWRVNNILQVNQSLVQRRLREATLFLSDKIHQATAEVKKKVV